MIIVKPNPVGTFSFCVPLKHLCGYVMTILARKVVYGVKHSLLLLGKLDSEVIFRDGDANPVLPLTVAAASAITLTKLAWLMPHVIPPTEYKNELDKLKESKWLRFQWLFVRCTATSWR